MLVAGGHRDGRRERPFRRLISSSAVSSLLGCHEAANEWRKIAKRMEVEHESGEQKAEQQKEQKGAENQPDCLRSASKQRPRPFRQRVITDDHRRL